LISVVEPTANPADLVVPDPVNLTAGVLPTQLNIGLLWGNGHPTDKPQKIYIKGQIN